MYMYIWKLNMFHPISVWKFFLLVRGLKYKRNFNKLQVLYCNNYNKWRTNLDQIQ